MTYSAFEHAGDIYSKASSIGLFRAKALDKSPSAAKHNAILITRHSCGSRTIAMHAELI